MGGGRGAFQGLKKKENKHSVVSQKSSGCFKKKRRLTISDTAEGFSKDRDIPVFGVVLTYRFS